jgi:hypothetical protein
MYYNNYRYILLTSAAPPSEPKRFFGSGCNNFLIKFLQSRVT